MDVTLLKIAGNFGLKLIPLNLLDFCALFLLSSWLICDVVFFNFGIISPFLSVLDPTKFNKLPLKLKLVVDFLPEPFYYSVCEIIFDYFDIVFFSNDDLVR